MRKLTFAQRYMIVSFVVMLAGMLIIGAWVAQLIEERVASRTAAVTALYVDSYVAPYLQELKVQDDLNPPSIAFFKRLLSENVLGRQMLSFKIWSPDGRVVYSQETEQIGELYPIEAGLAVALRGEVYTELSSLDREEHEFEREIASELIETYAPVRAFNSDEIIAVSEFYQSADELRADIRAAQVNSWLVVASVMLTVYLLLAGIVRRASKTIEKQQLALQQHVNQLNLLLVQNSELHERSQRAAAHSTDLNERYLRRISADLHDGPAQDLALALLHMDALEKIQNNGSGESRSDNGEEPADIEVVRGSVKTALNELRNISAGLRMPHLRYATAEETVRRAVRDYEQKSGCDVNLSIRSVPNQAPMSTKIALYRIIKEALNNGYFHADGKEQAVRVSLEEGQLYVEIEDHGPGFDPAAVTSDKHLGLISMAERVEMLGGQFDVDSVIGRGTIIKAYLPMVLAGDHNE